MNGTGFGLHPLRCLRAIAATGISAMLLAGTSAADNTCPGLDYAITLVTQQQQRRQHFQLDNGVQVVLLPDADATTAAVVTTIAVGAADEADGETGYAHLFEHLMFRGSATLPDGAYAKLIDRVGGQYNAETHYDYTSYYATVPAEALPQLIWQEAQRFRAPILTATTVQSEIATVLEENALRVDNVPFMRSAADQLFGQWRHPDYDHPVIGSATDLQAATPERLQAFYQRHYRPERTVLVIAGRFDPMAVRAQLSRDWTDWRGSGNAMPVRTPSATVKPVFSSELVDHRAPWPALALIWQTEPDTHPDAAAISVLQQWLLHGEQGWLRQQLLARGQLLHSMQLPLTMPRLGLATFLAVPRAATSLDELQQSLDELLRTASTVLPDASALCELKTAIARRHIAALELPHALAYRESLDLVLWQQSQLVHELQQLHAVDVEALDRVLQAQLLSGHVSLRLLPPWYVRVGKRLLEWLPRRWTDALEASAL